MISRIKSILFVVSIVMAFTAQTNRPDDKERQHNTPVARPSPVAHNDQNRPQVQIRKEAPQQVVHRQEPTVQSHFQAPHQESTAPRVYAVPASAPVQNNRFLHRQHHKNWQPRYNFYDDQYHFYPYVNIASTVELSADGISVVFDGQEYFYDEGTFYLQDAQGEYAAVAPPVGIIVNALPAHARQFSLDGQIYYRYKGVFYVQVAEGYQVVGPVESPSDDA